MLGVAGMSLPCVSHYTEERLACPHPVSRCAGHGFAVLPLSLIVGRDWDVFAVLPLSLIVLGLCCAGSVSLIVPHLTAKQFQR